MLNPLLTILFALQSALALPTESEQYRRQVLATTTLDASELVGQYARQSFAPIWLHSAEATTFGFIGPDYRRLRIRLLTIRPDTAAGHYHVTGKAKVGTNVTDFAGELQVLHVRADKGKPQTLDNQPTPAVKTGIVLASYELRERKEQAGSGVFRGILHARWYQDRQGRLYYNDLQSYADNYANNQCVGTWQSYRSGAVKRCNWGDYRIPNSGDLDIGAGEFSPAAKYRANGWQPEPTPKIARPGQQRAWWQ